MNCLCITIHGGGVGYILYISNLYHRIHYIFTHIKYLHFFLIVFKLYEKSRELGVQSFEGILTTCRQGSASKHTPPARSQQARELRSPARRDPNHCHLGCGMLGTHWAWAPDLWRHCAAPYGISWGFDSNSFPLSLSFRLYLVLVN